MLGDYAAAEAALIDALHASLVIDDRPGLVLRVEMLGTAPRWQAGAACRGALGAAEMLRLRLGAQISPFTANWSRGPRNRHRLPSGKPDTRRP